ncbi:hypothetical protein G6F35_002117 [Rhizopus arrhizus]|nr:hypothetical protein G6F35_002117 [Rhizopus arrhizus]
MHSIENLLNNFKKLDLKTRLPETRQCLGEETSVITTEDLHMEHEEEEDHADLGVGIGHEVTLFNLEVEDEAPQLPTTNHLSLIRQPNQNPTTANNNIYSPSTTNNNTHKEQQNNNLVSKLHDPSGWPLTRWSPGKILPLLDPNNVTQMAALYCERGLQDSIRFKTSTMETQEINTTESIRPASSKRGGEQIPYSRNNRIYAKSIRKLSFKILHNSRKHQTKTNIGLPKIESAHPVRTLQDGRNAYTVVPIHQDSRRFLTFKNEGIVYQYRSLAFGLNVAPRLFSKLMRYAIEPLRQEGIRLVYYLDDICLLGKSKEELTTTSQKCPHSISNAGIPGIPIQHEKDENHSPNSKDQQTVTTYQTSFTTCPEIMPMDRRPTGESHLDDSSNWRSPTSYSLSSTRSSEESPVESSELGKTLLPVSAESTRTPMMEGISINEERPTNSNNGSTHASNYHLHRQFGNRMGNQFAVYRDIRVLERDGQNTFNKRPRVESSLLCTEDTCNKIRKLHNQGIHRQHYSPKIYNERWRDSITTASGVSSPNPGLMQSAPPQSNLPTHCRSEEHTSRQVITETHTSIRMDDSKETLSTNSTDVGTAKDRRLCSVSQQPTTKILESPSRSIRSSSRCLLSEMVEEGYVLEPTVEIDSEGASKTKEVPCTTSSSGDSTLAESILVADDPTNETPRPSHDHESQQVLPSRMDIINKARNQSGLMNETSVSYLQDTTRSKTAENYDHGWRRWQLWCTQQVPQVDPTEYNQTNVLNFLVAHQRFSVSHLNSFRSSIASVFRVLYPEHMPIANQEQIQAFFATKRRSEVHIPSTSQLETWDTDKMVLFLLSTWADSSLLSLYDLQLKTIALLCLATMARPRSDIGRLQHRDIIFTFQDCSTSSSSALTGVTIHFRKPKETQVKTSKFGVLQDTRLCPASTLHLFIQKTNHLRESLPVDHTLFLAYIDKPAQVSSIRPSTLSN